MKHLQHHWKKNTEMLCQIVVDAMFLKDAKEVLNIQIT